jgi:hypothetical protein
MNVIATSITDILSPKSTNPPWFDLEMNGFLN